MDVAVETGDAELLDAVAAQFDRTLARRTYLTGGMGSRHADEAFGDDFVLPADRAYSETCAGVAAVMLAWRLLLATGEPRYGDVIERVLYNVVATAIGDDGRVVLLRQHAAPAHAAPEPPPADRGAARASAAAPRAPWFEVSCCLPNMARLLASLSDLPGHRRRRRACRCTSTPTRTCAPGSTAAGRSGSPCAPAYPDDGTVASG